MPQLTFVASVASLLMLLAFFGVAPPFDGAPFDTPLDTLYAAPADRIALRVIN
ncbi:MAG: hypothetical protein ACPGQV_07585 [Alphaproteobacteria bacterium]